MAKTRKTVLTTVFEIGQYAVTRRPMAEVPAGAQVVVTAIGVGAYNRPIYTVRDSQGRIARAGQFDLVPPMAGLL